MELLLSIWPMLIGAIVYFAIVIRIRNKHEKGLLWLSDEARGRLITDLKPIRNLSTYLLLGIVVIFVLVVSMMDNGYSHLYSILYLLLILGIQVPMGFYQKKLLAEKGYDERYVKLTGELVWMRLLAIGIMGLALTLNALNLDII
ncbi:MAG: hypothetical protein O3C22_04425 [Bacteroidetes bacterium]|nr:hypothetical protein [Bacteroidota bacterium]MDA0943437.1 hypothetical protein [Bacteroidota bacterium]MDA1111704.1 hypothetical protein [Bacteroidota bacterium]